MEIIAAQPCSRALKSAPMKAYHVFSVISLHGDYYQTGGLGDVGHILPKIV